MFYFVGIDLPGPKRVSNVHQVQIVQRTANHHDRRVRAESGERKHDVAHQLIFLRAAFDRNEPEAVACTILSTAPFSRQDGGFSCIDSAPPLRQLRGIVAMEAGIRHQDVAGSVELGEPFGERLRNRDRVGNFDSGRP